jgi:cadmium resistance protein CadD (predicted permease)
LPGGSLLVVDRLLGMVGTAVGVFAGTNVDDIIVLTVLFLSSRASDKPVQPMTTGEHVAACALVAPAGYGCKP